jgi:hypothetical protein
MYKFGSVQDVISLQEFVKEYDSRTTKVANTKAAKFAAELEKTAYTINKVLPAASKASRGLFKLSPTTMGRMGGGALGGALMGGAWGALSPDTPTNIFGQRQAPTFGDRVRSAAGNAFAFGSLGALGGLYSPKIKRFLTKPRVSGTPRIQTTPKDQPVIPKDPPAIPKDPPAIPKDPPATPPATPPAHPYYADTQVPQGRPSVNRGGRGKSVYQRRRYESYVASQPPQRRPSVNRRGRGIVDQRQRYESYVASQPPQTPPQTPRPFPHVATHDIPPSTSAAGGTVSQAPAQVSPIKAMFQERAMGAQVAPNTSGAPRPTVTGLIRRSPWWGALAVPVGVGSLYATSNMMPDQYWG